MREFFTDTTANTNANTAIQAATVRPVFFIEIEITSSSYLRFCTAGHDVSWTHSGGTNTYLGTGAIINVSPIQETQDLQSSGIKVAVSGLESSILSHILNNDFQNRKMEVSFAMISVGQADTTFIKPNELPTKIFVGNLDTATLADNGDTCSIVMTVENKLTGFERTKTSRYTYDEQINRSDSDINSLDISLEYVVTIQKRVLQWGT